MKIKSRKKGYNQIMDILRREITQNMYAGEKIASQRELAKQFGVSQNIIHRVLNQLATEGLVTRKKRLGSFVLPFKGQTNRPPEYYDLCVGLFHGRSEEYIFGENLTSAVVTGLHDEIEQLNRHLLYISRRRNGILPDPDDIPWNILYGLIVYNINQPDTLAEIARRGRDKSVLLDVNGREFGLHSVSFKNYEAGADLAEIMLNAGHRKFLVFSQKSKDPNNLDPAFTERIAGFTETINNAPDTAITVVDFYRKAEWPANFEKNVRKIIKARKYTAVFAPNTSVFNSYEKWFADEGMVYPGNYSVASIGGTEIKEGAGITRVAFSMAELAREGIRLLAQICEKKPDQLIHNLVEGGKVPGHSVSPPA